jgi:hypothetical protein
LFWTTTEPGPGVLVVRLTAADDTQGTIQMTSSQPQVRRTSASTAWFPFRGQPVRPLPRRRRHRQATVPAANQTEITGELATILHDTTRQALQQALDQRSDGRLRLDLPTSRSG